jgi:hypothetical protein
MSPWCLDSGVAVQNWVVKAAAEHLMFIGGDPPASVESARTQLTSISPSTKVECAQGGGLVFHRHQPPASPHGEDFFVKPAELSRLFHVVAF